MVKAPDRPPTLLASTTYLAGWVAQRAHADVRAALGKRGLDTKDFGVLVALLDFDALSQQQLADRLGVDKSNVVRLIDDLERRELVTRTADPTDRRRHRIELTSAGQRLLRAAVPAIEAVEAEHLEPLSPAERRTLTALLQRVLRTQDARPTK